MSEFANKVRKIHILMDCASKMGYKKNSIPKWLDVLDTVLGWLLIAAGLAFWSWVFYG